LGEGSPAALNSGGNGNAGSSPLALLVLLATCDDTGLSPSYDVRKARSKCVRKPKLYGPGTVPRPAVRTILLPVRERREPRVLRRLIKASVVVAGVGLVVTGCAVTPVKLGSAAIVGNQRISIATLDGEVANLSQAAKQYPGVVTLTATEQTQATLTWLIRYQVSEELASQQGITISPAQASAALRSAYDNAKVAAQEQGVTHVTVALILAASGIPPDTSAELGRYEAIADQYLKNVSGGKTPATGSAAATAAGSKLTKAECLAAKALDIQVNPQYGQLDFSQLQVVPAPPAMSRTQGPVTSASPVATAPAC
jgi:hypothetical protein